MAKDFKAKIEWLAIDKITPYANNAKKHPIEQIDRLAGQIAKFGFDQPIVVDKDRVIIKGHGRREAAMRLGMKEVPVIMNDKLTEYEAMAARLADNQLPTYGEIDDDLLKFELGTLSRQEDIDLKDTGYDLKEIENILADDLPPEEDDSEDSAEDESQFIVSVHCESEPQMQEIYEELKGRGFSVKLIT